MSLLDGKHARDSNRFKGVTLETSLASRLIVRTVLAKPAAINRAGFTAWVWMYSILNISAVARASASARCWVIKGIFLLVAAEINFSPVSFRVHTPIPASN